MRLTVQGELLIINDADKTEMKQLYSLATASVPNFIKNRTSKRNGSDWSGQICMLIDGAYLPLGLWNDIYKLRNAKFPYHVQIDGLLNTFDMTINDNEVEQWCESLDTPFQPHEDQFKFMLKMLKSCKCTLNCSTSFGKTYMTYLTLRYLRDHNKLKSGYKALMIVPSILLTDQAFSDIESYQLNTYKPDFKQCNASYKVYKIHSQAWNVYKQNDCDLIVGTYQSLINMPKDWFEQFDAVMCDECHKAEAKSIIQLMCNCKNASYKFGVSGSIDDNDKLLMLTIQSYIGAHLGKFTLREAIDKEIVSDLYIKRLLIKHSEKVDHDYANYLNEHKDLFDIDKAGQLIHAETHHCMQCEQANNVIASIICKLDMNALVLVKRRGHVENLTNTMQTYCALHNIDKVVHAITGGTPLHERHEMIDAMRKEPTRHIMVATIQTLSTGVSVKEWFYAAFVNLGKSNNTLLQSIGRMIRKHPLKQKAMIIDICQQLWIDMQFKNVPDSYRYRNYDIRHAQERVKQYKNQQLEFDDKPTVINI